jgi:signal transduction histidine kinase
MVMAEDQQYSSASKDLEDLQREVLDLRRQLAESRARNRAMWSLLAEVSQRLQVSSTSIKAAVSSLLDYDIFWDGSTQHEFLETIDESVEQGASLIVLMALAFRSEASKLEMNPEPHALQEILSTVVDTVSLKMPELQLKADFPAEGRPVFVDYRYLVVALRLLLEVLVEPETVSSPIDLVAVDAQDSWFLDIKVIPAETVEAISYIHQDQFEELVAANKFSPENLLKLFTASRILRLQNIQLIIIENEAGETRVRLTIPAAVLGT